MVEPAARSYAHARDQFGPESIFALEISHPVIDPPVRVVSDTIQHTVEGNIYYPVAFRAEVPQSKKGEIPQASLEIDNVGREIMQWVERSNGGRGASMRVLKLIPPADGETESQIVWEVPALSVGVTAATSRRISMSLVYRSGKGRPGIKVRHDPVVSPGLF